MIIFMCDRIPEREGCYADRAGWDGDRVLMRDESEIVPGGFFRAHPADREQGNGQGVRDDGGRDRIT